MNLPTVAAAGGAIFSNQGLLFAIGLRREDHRAAGLASAVCYIVATRRAEVPIEVTGLIGLPVRRARAERRLNSPDKLHHPPA